MIKNILFDFDGVICESVHIKTEAFYEIYLPYGEEVAQKVKTHHLANGGMSRYDKFRYYEKSFLHTELADERMKALSDTFSSLVKQKVIAAPFIKGALAFLKEHAQNYTCFIVSATPMGEMQEIAKAKKIDRYFKEIYGSPTTKTVWTAHILETYGLKREESLFIGDAKNDYVAAKENGLHFLWRKTEEIPDIPSSVPQVADLESLHTLLTNSMLFK